MSNLPNGWIPNMPAPEIALGEYTGDHTADWSGNPPASTVQPGINLPGISAMGVTAEVAALFEGPQKSTK
jgi:hypothetical protein